MDNLAYKSTQNRKGVLGTLEGICADCIHATRNGRRYNESVWTHAFNDPLIKEHFKNGGIFGQLGHPKEDQSETEELANIAICMPEPPVKGPDGKLRGRWDILDTPNGRILKCLCDYGYKIGISSRGNGEVITDYDGTESVDPETFQFKAFDAVLLPAVKEARLNLITESVNKTDNLKKALKESIDHSNDIDKEVMLKTLENLGIDYNSSEQSEDIIDSSKNIAAENDGADVIKELQTALKENNDLKNQIFELKETLSVSSTKEKRSENQIKRFRELISQQKQSLKEAENLKEQLLFLQERLDETNETLVKQKQLIKHYKNNAQQPKVSKNNLIESVNDKKIIESLQKKIKSLNETINQNSKDKNLIESLQKEVNELKQDSQINYSQYTKKLQESKNQAVKYKNIADKAFNNYIESKALIFNIPVKDIKARLTESYSFEEVDSICESLRGYGLNISKLPFQLKDVKKISMKEDLQKQELTNPDDVIDDTLLNLLK